MSKEQRVSVCHIQHDFEACIAEEGDDGKFYLNVDKSLDKVNEFIVNVSAQGTRFELPGTDSFQKVDNHLYSATLDHIQYHFRTMVEDYTNADPSSQENDIQWTTVHVTESPEVRYALGDSKGNFRVYDGALALQRDVKGAHEAEITSLQFFPSGEVLLSASADMRLKLWSVLDGSCPRTFIGHRSAVTDTCLIDRGRNFLSSSTDGAIRLWECGSGQTISVLSRKENPNDGINSMSLRTSAPEEKLQKSENPLEFGTCGKQVLAGHASGVITLHDVFDKQQISQLPSCFLSSCNAVTVDYKREEYVYAGYQNGALAQWDLRNVSSPVTMAYINEGTPVNSIYLQSDGLYISSGLDTSLRLDLSNDDRSINYELPTFLVSNDYKVAQYTSTPDGKHIIAVGDLGFCGKYTA